MRQDGQAGRARKAGVEPLVDRRDDLRNGLVARSEPRQDRRLAHPPVLDKAAQEGGRPFDRTAMAGQIAPVAPFQEPVERGHVVAHRTVRGRDDRRRPGHDVVAGQEDPGLAEREGDVIGRMARRRDDLDRQAAERQLLAVRQDPVEGEPAVDRLVDDVGR